jgi:hypothetical protein
LSQLQTVAEENETHWREKVAGLERELQKLRGELGETVLAMEWRERYEQLKLVTEKLRQAHDDDSTVVHIQSMAELETSVNMDSKDIETLKAEFAVYRKRALHALELKERQLKEVSKQNDTFMSSDHEWMHAQPSKVRTASSASSVDGRFSSLHHHPHSGIHHTNHEYLKNVVIKYMSTDQDDVKERMEAAIATVLNFTSLELQQIQEKRKQLQQQHAGWLALW